MVIRSQFQIMKDWRQKGPPLVSISCITYNHADFIRDVIEGFLMQKTTFPFEVLIHDDASTDGTEEIVREYEAEYPDIIKPLYETENQWVKGRKGSKTFNFPRALGKYIALCEGDDYWTDPLKLQKQFDFLEANPDCTLVFHAAQIISATNKSAPSIKRNDTKSRFFSMEELIMGGGGLIATASMIFRAKTVNNLPVWFYTALVGDYPLVLLIGSQGCVFYIDEVMSTYRKDVPSSITANSALLSYLDFMERSLRLVQILVDFDAHTNYQYHDAIESKISDYLFTQFKNKGTDANFFQRYLAYKKIRHQLDIKKKREAFRLIILNMPLISSIYRISQIIINKQLYWIRKFAGAWKKL